MKRLKADTKYLQPRPEDATLAASNIDFESVDREIAEAFWRQMHEGTLIAIGYVERRQIKDPPQIVPAEIIKSCSRFSPFFRYGSDEFTGAGLHFKGVRVAQAVVIRTFKTRGRRSRKPEIQASLKKLKLEGKVSPGAPWRVVPNAIRADLIKSPDDDWGLQIDAVRRALKGLHRQAHDLKKAKSKKTDQLFSVLVLCIESSQIATQYAHERVVHCVQTTPVLNPRN